MSALEDPEVSVRRVALVAFNSAVHNKPSLVRDLLVSLLPQLYEETKVKVSAVIYIYYKIFTNPRLYIYESEFGVDICINKV